MVRHSMDPRWQGAPRPARSAERAVRSVSFVRLLYASRACMAGLGFPGWWWRAAGRLGNGGRTIGATWRSRPALPKLWQGRLRGRGSEPRLGVAGLDHPVHQGGAVNLTVARNVPIASASLARVQIPMDRGQRSERSRTTRRTRLKRPALKSLHISDDDEHRFGQSSSLRTPDGGNKGAGPTPAAVKLTGNGLRSLHPPR
jgi:hypothetical protein